MLLREKIEKLYEQDKASIDKQAALQAFNELKFFLNYGEIRAASPHQNTWTYHQWVKKGILLGFNVGDLVDVSLNEQFRFFDKNTYTPKKITLEHRVRLSPGGTYIHDGVYLGPHVTILSPTTITIGAFVDEYTSIDTHSFLGPCVQIGKRVHIGTGTYITSTLTELTIPPAIVEDDVYIQGMCSIGDGVIVQRRAVLAQGVHLTHTTQLVDLVNSTIYCKNDSQPLIVPEGAVVVPGTRTMTNDFARTHGIGIYTPLIVQYRPETLSAETALITALQ